MVSPADGAVNGSGSETAPGPISLLRVPNTIAVADGRQKASETMTYTYPPFYDVESSVGEGASPNGESDVMLVQYLLYYTLVDSTWPMPFGPQFPPGVNGLDAIFPIQGTATAELGSWIRTFQSVANANDLGPLAVDGIVSHGGAAWGQVKPRAANWFAIHALNHLLFQADQDRFWNLATDDTVPPALQQALALRTDLDPVPL